MRGIDPRAPDHSDPIGINPGLGKGSMIFRVLHHHPPVVSSRDEAKSQPEHWPAQPCRKARMRKAGAQAHDRIDHAGSVRPASESEPPSHPPEQHRLQRNMVDKIRLLCSIEPSNFGYGTGGANQPIAASAPRDRADGKALFSNSIAMSANAGCDDDLESGAARGAGDRQPMRTEIPVLGNQKEQLWPPQGIRRGN